jgi:hypothetical protein
MQRSRHYVALTSAIFVVAIAATAQVPQPDAATAASAPAVPLKTYTDPANSVSFQYPAAWTLSQQGAFYAPPSIIQPDQPPQAVVSFSPAGSDFSHTNLAGLEFTYVASHSPRNAPVAAS